MIWTKLLKLLLVAGCVAAQPASQGDEAIKTTDYAECAQEEDRAVCYLRLAYQSGYLRGDVLARLESDPHLREAIGITGIPEPEGIEPDTETRSEMDKLIAEPSRIAASARMAALERDARGLPPEEALRPLLTANEGLQSRSIYLGQITTQSAVELRIEQYERILRLHTNPNEQATDPVPSAGLVREALRAWENDLSRPLETFTDFDQDDSLRELASGFALTGDIEAARRVLRKTRLDPLRIDLEVALAVGDLDTAWAITVSSIEALSELPRFVHLNSLPRLAFHKGDTELLNTIKEKLSEDEFADKIDQGVLFDALKYLGPKTFDFVRKSLERRRHESGFPGLALAKLWAESGDVEELDRQIDILASRAQECDRSSGCPQLSQLLGLLAIRGRVDEVYALIGEDKAESLFNITPYPPFRDEVDLGEGPPSSIEILIDHHRAKGAYFSLEGDLRRCAFSRLDDRRRRLALEPTPDWDGAYACVLKLIEVVEFPASIAAHNDRYDRTIPALKERYSHGRFVAASTALSLARLFAESHEERSIHLEREALRLLSNAPERNVYGSFVPLAIKRLEMDGRL